MPSFKSIAVLTSCIVTLPFLGLGLRYTVRDREFYIMEGKSLIGNVTVVRQVTDLLDCSFLCLELGPYGCLSFNFEKSDGNDFHSCELSNSEKHFDPNKIQERSSYDYYGTSSKSLFRIRPCASSPCKHGGTCIEGPNLGEFSCHCKLAPIVLPFIDNVCNVDKNDFLITSPVVGVFHGEIVKRYNLNFYSAKRLCGLLGAQLATYSQLYAAWQAGLEKCLWAWLADSTVRFPM